MNVVCYHEQCTGILLIKNDAFSVGQLAGVL
jgi:hypothetical protein